MTNSADLLFTNGIVMTMDPENTILENGAVAVCADTITAVGSAVELA